MRNASYWGLILAGSLVGFIWGANQVALSIYLVKIGLDAAQIGAVYGVSTAAMTAGSLLWGYLADIYDRRRLYYALSFASATFTALMATARPFVVAASYISASLLNRGVVYSAILGDYAKARGLSNEAFSLSSSLSSFFAALGSLSASITAAGIPGFQTLFLLESLAIAVSAALLSLSEPIAAVERGGLSLNLRTLRSYWLLKRLIPESLIGLGAGVIIPLFSLWFYIKFHVAMGSLAVFYAASDLTLALGAASAPLIARALRSRVDAIVVLQSLATALLASMPFVGSAEVALSLFVARTALMNMANPLLSALINDLVPQEERGRVFGLWNTLSSVPRAVGPAIGGYLMGSGMIDAPLFITAGLYAVAVALFKALLGQAESRLARG
ncbi:major facilitator superfamily MFS_1 [Thermoproteus uzoniensis 768-20]|uniref:Major facilitator superfamily MFS_1 n=1 Tax=Thermoproteus uzoniensis (strain 768-20) TaxID=999630 RepID=F2L4C9_THEU7|nr:MFS transporter [Thermoproteus uzoniensis]AEA13361.1 major facilitator superfamily MFS_1 [Thermoproteus uzoniensis 768-20]